MALVGKITHFDETLYDKLDDSSNITYKKPSNNKKRNKNSNNKKRNKNLNNQSNSNITNHGYLNNQKLSYDEIVTYRHLDESEKEYIIDECLLDDKLLFFKLVDSPLPHFILSMIKGVSISFIIWCIIFSMFM